MDLSLTIKYTNFYLFYKNIKNYKYNKSINICVGKGSIKGGFLNLFLF